MQILLLYGAEVLFGNNDDDGDDLVASSTDDCVSFVLVLLVSVLLGLPDYREKCGGIAPGLRMVLFEIAFAPPCGYARCYGTVEIVAV